MDASQAFDPGSSPGYRTNFFWDFDIYSNRLYIHIYYDFFIVISFKYNSNIIDIANEYNKITNNKEFKYIILYYMNYSKIKTLLFLWKKQFTMINDTSIKIKILYGIRINSKEA